MGKVLDWLWFTTPTYVIGIVAAEMTIPVGAWKAYIGAIPFERHMTQAVDADRILREGTHLPLDVAGKLFENLPLEKYYR